MKKLTMLLSMLCLTAALAVPASALEYDIAAPGDPEYGKPTSVEPVVTADRGELPNVDVSKNAALVPPAFGSAGTTVAPPDYSCFPSGGTSSVLPTTGFTEVTSDLYYQGGYLATLKIPSIDVNVKVYEGTGSSVLRKGAGHFEDTSIWAGNICVAAHNRGVNAHFGEIHTLDVGDEIILTTKLGKRTYAVTSVNKISEMENSLLAPTAENCITLFTCVRNQSAYRWAVRAVEVP